jgi:alkanesulfonate monooxygenase SsuD/methylene tetrahydromethanopterin reductase-like flavin-dependent oxidoreductase (luciferase family)
LISGVVGAALALGATDELTVGIGVLPAPTRHPAAVAMDVATLAGAYPGRLRAGLGTGVPAWIERLGVMPKSPGRFIADYAQALHALLAGRAVTAEVFGSAYRLDDVRLSHPPTVVPPLAIGAVGPYLLKVAARHADHVILSSLAAPEYVTWAGEILTAEAQHSGRAMPRRVCFVATSVHDDRAEAARLVRPDLAFVLAAMGTGPLTAPLGVDEELSSMLAHGAEALAAGMPDEWVRRMSITGNPDDVAERVEAYRAAGVDELVFSPKPGSRTVEVLTAVARVLGLKGRP